MSTAQEQVRYLEVEQRDVATIIRFVREQARAIIDEAQIQKLGHELNVVTETLDRPLILDFSHVHFISSAFLGKLIWVDKVTRGCQQPVILCSMIPEIYEVFALSKLNKLFEWADTLEEALAKAAAYSAEKSS